MGQKTESTLAQVMACCLMAPSHYLNQYWLIISKVLWHFSEGNFTAGISAINHWNWLEKYSSKIPLNSPRPQLVKGCVSLDPSKISKSGWWGLQLDTWQLCNSLWYGLINSKLHINKKNIFFISHNIRQCHTSNVFNHPADLSGMDLTSDPSWFTHSPGKASTKRYSPQIFKGSLLFSLSIANKMKQILCHLFWYQMTVSALQNSYNLKWWS